MRAACTAVLAFALLARAGDLGAEPAADKPAAAYVIIVHPANKVAELTREFVRNAYLKKATTWSGGETIRPVDLNRRFPVRKQFTEQVLKKSMTQLKIYWNQQIFSGKGVPPPEKDSEAAVITYVLSNKGAIGYLAAGADPRGAKVVGLAP